MNDYRWLRGGLTTDEDDRFAHPVEILDDLEGPPPGILVNEPPFRARWTPQQIAEAYDWRRRQQAARPRMLPPLPEPRGSVARTPMGSNTEQSMRAPSAGSGSAAPRDVPTITGLAGAHMRTRIFQGRPGPLTASSAGGPAAQSLTRPGGPRWMQFAEAGTDSQSPPIVAPGPRPSVEVQPLPGSLPSPFVQWPTDPGTGRFAPGPNGELPDICRNMRGAAPSSADHWVADASQLGFWRAQIAQQRLRCPNLDADDRAGIEQFLQDWYGGRDQRLELCREENPGFTRDDCLYGADPSIPPPRPLPPPAMDG